MAAAVGAAALNASADSDEPTAPTATPTTPASASGRNADPPTPSASGTAASSTTTTPPASSTTTSPFEPPRRRPPVEVTVTPESQDAVGLARWWAATYSIYSGSDTPARLADRLAGVTAQGLLDELRGVPPAASYDEPETVAGVTAAAPVGLADGSMRVRVTVETREALSVYEVTLEPAASGWRVSGVARL